jgi:hypothetical protein
VSCTVAWLTMAFGGDHRRYLMEEQENVEEI